MGKYRSEASISRGTVFLFFAHTKCMGNEKRMPSREQPWWCTICACAIHLSLSLSLSLSLCLSVSLSLSVSHSLSHHLRCLDALLVDCSSPLFLSSCLSPDGRRLFSLSSLLAGVSILRGDGCLGFMLFFLSREQRVMNTILPSRVNNNLFTHAFFERIKTTHPQNGQRKAACQLGRHRPRRCR